ncbi:MAG: HigA family addiction module antidote protein [Saprospiraceae bacterium]|nr:HigA family addiction module antidote protein [Saprospiraceae bacterium]
MKLNKSKFKAIHPSELLKSELIDERKLTITSIAGMLKVSRQALSNVLNSKASISPEMAWRISIVLAETLRFG